MRSAPPFVGLAVAVLLAACAGAATPPNSGVSGQVLIGPTCPVIQFDTPCPDQPFQATIVVRDDRGRQVTRFQADAQGRFRVALEPGTFTLVPESPGALTHAPEQTVQVLSGQFTPVTITYDSGIR